MVQVASVDYAARRIYLHPDTAAAGIFNPVEAYREVRTLRRTTLGHRKFPPIISAQGNQPKGGGVFTERRAVLIDGARFVPHDASHDLAIVVEVIIPSEGLSNRLAFDRAPLSPGVVVNIDNDVDPVEIREVAVGGGGGSGGVDEAGVRSALTAHGLTEERAARLDNLDAPISGVQAGGGAVVTGPISLFTDPNAQEALLSTDTLIVEGIGPLRRGDSWDIEGVVAAGGDPKTPIDVTGDTITLTLKRSYSDADPILEVDATVVSGPDGRIAWVVPADQTDLIADGQHVAQVRRFPAGGGVKTLWFGRVRIQPDL